MSDAYFTTDDGVRFTPTHHARGPWAADACHAGPPTGLLVRALEALSDLPLVRITVDLLRPVPMTGFALRAELREATRRSARSTVVLHDDDRVHARAEGLHLLGEPLDAPPTAAVAAPRFAESVSGPFPVGDTAHGLPFFGDSVEVRWDSRRGTDRIGSGGESIIWLRTTVPLIAGEEPSPFQRIAPLADCGNGISYNAPLGEYTFVNPDLTVWLHRAPVGDWHASHSRSHWQPSGLGASEAILHDTLGPVGGAVQTLLVGR